MHHRAARRTRRPGAAVILTLALLVTLVFTLPESASAWGTERIASGLNRPIYATGVDFPGTGEIVYVVEQRGQIYPVVNGTQSATAFLNIDSQVYNPSGNDERGMLGFALHPDFTSNGEFFVHYNNNGGTTTISRITLNAMDPLDADESSEEILLTVAQPFSNHNGGWIDFGPDGYLYIALGDGGAAGDPGNRAQNGATLLGKMLRIDVDNGSPYSIPADNPFAAAGDGFLDEIWSYGLRNAWRNSFDRETGELWIADVGQNAWEEIDFEPANTGGRNYGWRRMEGLVCFNPSNDCNDGSLTLPIHVYPHNSSGGFSVSGGYVHRDPSVPELNGLYIFADFVIPNIFVLEHDGSGGNVTVTNRSSEFSPSMDGFTINTISSFGEGPNGELYIVSRGGTTTGAVFQVVGDPADTGDVQIDPVPSLRLELASSNPFTPASPLQFAVSLPESGELTVAVVDATGRQVRTLVEGTQDAGSNSFVWNGRNDAGDFAPSGVYFLRAVTPKQTATQKVGFLR